jgi:transcriptional regulator with XRE-family HTH domain
MRPEPSYDSARADFLRLRVQGLRRIGHGDGAQGAGMDEPDGEWRRIGEILGAGRRAMGLRGYQLAAKADVHPSTVSRLERGLSPPERKTLTAVVTALRPGLEEIGALSELADRLATRGIDLPAIVGNPVVPPSLATPRDQRTWEALFAEGRRLNHHELDHHAAVGVLQAALARARDGAERAATLVEEAFARWRLAEEGFEAALVKNRQAIAALDLDWTRVDAREGHLPRSAIGELSDLGLKTYGVVAVRIGEVHFEQWHFAAAERWLAAAQEVDDLLGGDAGIGWSVWHDAMQIAFSRGTHPTAMGGWEVVDDRLVAQARHSFQMPHPRPLHPNLHVQDAHDARWEGRILALLGDAGAARHAYDRAEALFGGQADRAHVWRDRALLALRDDDWAASRDYLDRALDTARAMKYPQLVADVLRSLSYLDAATGARAGLRRALALAICALVVHPAYLDRGEGRVTVAFAADLVGSLADDPGRFWRSYRREVEAAIYAQRPPFQYGL